MMTENHISQFKRVQKEGQQYAMQRKHV